MTTTSLKLPDELKQRIQRFAVRENTTAHAFMVNTLASEVDRLEVRAAFLDDADAAAADIDAGGTVYSTDEVRRYLKAKLAARGSGGKVARPGPLVPKGAPAKRPARRK